MAIVRYSDNKGTTVNNNVTRRLIHTDGLMTVVVDFINGPAATPDPYHQHPHQQTTYVAQGEVLFLIEGEAPQKLVEGDLVAIEPNKNHAIQLLSATARLVDSFAPIRQDFL